MDHLAHVNALCAAWGITNDPMTGIPEDALGISELVFHTAKGDERRVHATHLNRATRMLIEQMTRETRDRYKLIIDQDVRRRFEEYFAERWEAGVSGLYPMIDTIKVAIGADIVWKK